MIFNKKVLGFLRYFFVFSGALFWIINLSLIFPIHNIMGWVGLFTIYWMMFGLPLSLMLVVLAFFILLIKKVFFKKLNEENKKW